MQRWLAGPRQQRQWFLVCVICSGEKKYFFSSCCMDVSVFTQDVNITQRHVSLLFLRSRLIFPNFGTVNTCPNQIKGFVQNRRQQRQQQRLSNNAASPSDEWCLTIETQIKLEPPTSWWFCFNSSMRDLSTRECPAQIFLESVFPVFRVSFGKFVLQPTRPFFRQIFFCYLFVSHPVCKGLCTFVAFHFTAEVGIRSQDLCHIWVDSVPLVSQKSKTGVANVVVSAVSLYLHITTHYVMLVN